MNKNGFSFIETVVTVVILSTSLLLVYNSYSSIITNEQQRLYYNDPAYIYRTVNVLDFLNYDSILMQSIKNDFDSSNKYVQQIGVNYSLMYYNNNQKNDIEQLINSYSINQMFIIKKAFFSDCHFSDDDNIDCKNSINELNSAEKFVKTVSSGDADYYFVVEYVEMSKAVGAFSGRLTKCYIASEQKYGCHYYYAAIPINGVYFV